MAENTARDIESWLERDAEERRASRSADVERENAVDRLISQALESRRQQAGNSDPE